MRFRVRVRVRARARAQLRRSQAGGAAAWRAVCYCGVRAGPGAGLWVGSCSQPGSAPSPALLCGAQTSARPGLAGSPGALRLGQRERSYRYREAAAATATFDQCGRTARPPRHPSMPPTASPATRAPRAGEARPCDRRWSGRTARSRSPPGRSRHHSPAPSRAAPASLTVGLGFAVQPRGCGERLSRRSTPPETLHCGRKQRPHRRVEMLNLRYTALPPW